MRIALDATYSVGDALSGIGVYSREILEGVAASGFPATWDWFYRSQRYWRTRGTATPPDVTRRFLADSFGDRTAELFHGLNQRLPSRRFRKQVTTFHDLFVLSGEYSTPEFRDRFARQARDAAAASDLIIAVSAFTAGQVEEYLGVPTNRIRVIHHGVLPRHIPVVPREKIVLCLGAIQRRKNHAGLVRAFTAMPSDWRLVLAGSRGFGAEDTFAEIERSPAKDRIEVTGYVTDAAVGEWYARSSIFAFPSLDEGFGMPVLEAMGAGLPVVVSNTSAAPEVAGDAALAVDPHSTDDLAKALLRLASDEKLRAELIHKGHDRAAGFTWRRAVDQTLAVYKELL